MTCGQWLEKGHGNHFCIECTSLMLPRGRCKVCEDEGLCGFIQATVETLKLRDEIFSKRHIAVLKTYINGRRKSL